MAAVKYTVVDGEILAELRNGVRKFYDNDANGDVIGLYDESQTKTDGFKYWSYGELRERTGTTPTKYQFSGAVGCRTQADGSVYMRARELNTKSAVFLTVDPYWPEPNTPYQYAYNNPATLNDPSGKAAYIPPWCKHIPPFQIFPPPSGIGSCYRQKEFGNCCTACGLCFTLAQECSNGVASFPGSGFKCGDILHCCTYKKCFTVIITDTGAGKSGRIIDFGCCFANNNGISRLGPVTCKKIGHKKIKRVCWDHSDCSGPKGNLCD